MSEELKAILSRCKLEQHFDYLATKGFGTWESLQLLDQSDFEQLQGIPYGHFKLLIQTIQQYTKEQNIASGDKKIRPKYKQFLKLLNKIQAPNDVFNNIDKQINKYQEIKQQYLENWALHQQYHSKISNFITKTSQSEIDAPVTSEEVRQFLASMQKLNASLQQLLQNMGNANYDVNSNEILENMTNISRNTSISEEFKIDTDKNIKPSKAKHSKKRSNSVKKKKTPSLWQYDEDKSLRDDVKLYVVSCAVKVDDFSNEDWKSISKMHNENFWKDTKYKGRSYKDLKSQYNKPPLTASDTSKDDMNGEIEEISASDNNNHNNNIPIIKSTSNDDDDDDDSSSDDEDALSGLLNAMQAPPQ